jgi:hypothetical protein
MQDRAAKRFSSEPRPYRRRVAQVLSLYLNSLRYSLGVQPVFLRKATLNELV